MQEMEETWIQSLEEEIATHSSILAWRTPWTEEPGGLQFMGSQRVGRSTHACSLRIGTRKCISNRFIGNADTVVLRLHFEDFCARQNRNGLFFTNYPDFHYLCPSISFSAWAGNSGKSLTVILVQETFNSNRS